MLHIAISLLKTPVIDIDAICEAVAFLINMLAKIVAVNISRSAGVISMNECISTSGYCSHNTNLHIGYTFLGGYGSMFSRTNAF